MRPISFILLFTLSAPLLGQQSALVHKSAHHTLMGVYFGFSLTAPENEIDQRLAECANEVRRIERMISSWDSLSFTSEINRQAGKKPVKVPDELFKLIARSLKVSDLTRGAFDISFASIDRIWRFDGSMSTLPDSTAVQEARKFIGHQNIILSRRDTTVFLSQGGMKIGFGAIGKGYAANRVASLMQQKGVTSGVVNAGGDIYTWGKDPKKKPWRFAIADPDDRKQVMAWFEVANTAVVTSGSYEKFVTFGGRRYAHIIDPRTGWPSEGLLSVTVICPDAELADALATSAFVLGKQQGLQLLEQLQGVEGILLTDDRQLLSTSGLNLNPQSVESENSGWLLDPDSVPVKLDSGNHDRN